MSETTQGATEKPKRPRGRPSTKSMPPRIDASPEEIARTVLRVPAKRRDEWRYLREDQAAPPTV